MNNIANSVFGMVLLACVVTLGNWLIHRPMFDIKKIQIVEQAQHELKHVSKITIRSHALPKLSGNFFTANLDQVRLAFESVPWVRRASIKREWPNKLLVELEEHQAFATWGDKGLLLSSAGEVFAANLAEAEDDTRLIEMSGPVGTEKQVLARYHDFNKWFGAVSLSVDSIRYSDRYAWSVQLNNGMKVEIGRLDEQQALKERVDKFMAVYPQLLASLQDSIETVDLRYTNGLALKSSHTMEESKKPQQANRKT